MRVLKFTLEIAAQQTVQMPRGARLLAVQVQRDQPQLWAACDEGEPAEPRGIRIVGTGHDVPDHLLPEYVGTFQLRDGALVFHVFGTVALAPGD